MMFLVPFSLLLTRCSDRVSGIQFNELPPDVTNVLFSNNIQESDSLDYYSFPYIYMGGGVAIGDVDNDGLSDVFFTGNMVKNKLYLNKGNLSFKDISVGSGVEGDGRWYTGATMVDINLDGWLDIYVCVSGKGKTKNQLFINNGDLTFSEMAEAYGIDDVSTSIQSTFFDYDNDGDLDLFVGNYPIIPISLGNEFYFNKIRESNFESSGHLYRNDGNNSFTDLTHEAGVQNYGLTLGVVAADFNEDGWQDLYISNDFQIPDYFYLNNQDGTFSEVLKQSVNHTSMFGMGVDASDFNNDGLIDLMQLDMAPEDYKRAKVNMASMNPENFWEIVSLGGHYQYMQNSLQVNNGPNQESIPQFSEISRYSGLATTDWSWGVLFADLDNDANKDLLITNGIRKDVNDNDVIKINEFSLNPMKVDTKELRSQPLSNYVFQNTGGFKFKNITRSAGFNSKGFSNGVAYGDLDNDGDLDIIISNLDGIASVYENKTENSNHYLRIKIKGPKENPNGLGTRITVFNGDKMQMQELTLTRGFQSSVEPIVHFGLGQNKLVERLMISWPDGSKQVLNDVLADQILVIEKDIEKLVEGQESRYGTKHNFTDITNKANIDFKHQEDLFDDFVFEPLLPHKNSAIGPGLTVGDVNNDGIEDFFIGNASGSAAALYLQKEDGTFIEMEGPWQNDKEYEDTGAMFFDPDNDGDLDLYVVSGGNDITKKDSYYRDRLYVNKGGVYIELANAIPERTGSGQVVISSDFDLDGDQDLFVGGRIVPGRYPYPATSYILRNDGGKDGELHFTDITKTIAPDLISCGLVTSALWQDFDQDGRPDLVIAGEWMALRFFKNNKFGFEEVTSDKGMEGTSGWWYSLESVDVDKDGDLDIVAGNLGLNYKYKTDENTTFEIYANDFDENGKSDIVLAYIKNGKELPVRGKECSSQQIPAIGHRFSTYKSFAEADLSDIYGDNMLKQSLKYDASTFAHHWIENKGSEKWDMHQLSPRSQFSSVNDIEIIYEDQDSFPDLLLVGNLYGSEVETPRNDASMGLLLKNKGSGDFFTQPRNEIGLMVKGEVKAVRSIRLGKNGSMAYLFAINNDSLRLLSMD